MPSMHAVWCSTSFAFEKALQGQGRPCRPCMQCGAAHLSPLKRPYKVKGGPCMRAPLSSGLASALLAARPDTQGARACGAAHRSRRLSRRKPRPSYSASAPRLVTSASSTTSSAPPATISWIARRTSCVPASPLHGSACCRAPTLVRSGHSPATLRAAPAQNALRGGRFVPRLGALVISISVPRTKTTLGLSLLRELGSSRRGKAHQRPVRGMHAPPRASRYSRAAGRRARPSYTPPCRSSARHQMP